MAIVTFANQPTTTVSNGGTGAPASGSSEAWTVASSATFPVASTSSTPATYFLVADTAATSEIIAVTVVTGSVWNVTRGAENTTPVTHSSGFTVMEVISAGVLDNFKQATNAITTPVTVATTVETLVAAYQPVTADIEAGVSFEAVAYGTFTTNNTVATNRQMVWTMRWGGTAGTILCQLKTNSNAPSMTTSVAAGSSYDMNATVVLLSATQATCNMNLFCNAASLTAAQQTATVTNATGGAASSSTPVTISGNGPLVLDFNWGGAITTQTMTAVAPVIYRIA